MATNDFNSAVFFAAKALDAGGNKEQVLAEFAAKYNVDEAELRDFFVVRLLPHERNNLDRDW